MLLAKSGLNADPLAPLGAAAGKYLLAALGLHAHAEAVLLAPLAPVGLECTLRHEKSVLLVGSTVYGQTISINEGRALGQKRSWDRCQRDRPEIESGEALFDRLILNAKDHAGKLSPNLPVRRARARRIFLRCHAALHRARDSYIRGT